MNNTFTSNEGNEFKTVETAAGTNHFVLEPVSIEPPPPPPSSEIFTLPIDNYLANKAQPMNLGTSTLYYNGKTFNFHVLDYSNGDNNKGVVVEYDGINDPIYEFVGTGTPYPDVWNHPGLSGVILNDGTIVCAQINGHNADINIHVFNTPGTILGGYTSYSITGFASGGKYSYPNLFLDNGVLRIFTRVMSVKGGGKNYSQAILTKGATFNDWDFKLVTKSTYNDTTNPSNIRHYPHKLTNHGVNNYHYFLVNMHFDGTNGVYPKQTRAVALYKTDDFVNYSNYDGTFSKSNNNTHQNNGLGGLKHDELQDNCIVYGSTIEADSNTGHGRGCVINDEAFIMTAKQGEALGQIVKVTGTGITYHDLQIPGFVVNPSISGGTSPKAHIYSNRNLDKLIILVEMTECEMWEVSLDLLTWAKVYTFAEGSRYGLPSNYEDIPTGFNYMVSGGNTNGEFKALLTNQIY
tara:strand:- start:384 stop:1772 length:1389 start_codon:yes stop_codon:yes gene_type:complete